MEERVHPELRQLFSVLPKTQTNRENLREVRQQMNQMVISMNAAKPVNDAVMTSERFIPGAEGDPDVRVKIYEPKIKNEILPGVLHFHGGGFIIGTADMFDANCEEIVKEVNCVVISVDYRLAPEHPFPAPVEDCYAALKWFSENAAELGVDPSRIAVSGGSAGGGLTAAISLLSRDRKGPSIAFQMPNYPMIDDRCITSSNNEITDERIFNGKSNQQAWDMYLGNKDGEVSQYAAPARATDLSGLPPTYTCVGELDPFRDETIEYVARLTKAGVPVEFHLYPGCFHGFEGFVPTAEISQRAIKEFHSALKRALHKNN